MELYMLWKLTERMQFNGKLNHYVYIQEYVNKHLPGKTMSPDDLLLGRGQVLKVDVIILDAFDRTEYTLTKTTRSAV